MHYWRTKTMNKVIEYKNFIISIADDDFIDAYTGKLIFKRYMTEIIKTNYNPQTHWLKDYDRDKYTIGEIIEEAKFHIDEYLKNEETYKITLTLRTKVSNPEELMKSIDRNIKSAISSYPYVRLEEVKACNNNKEAIFIDKIKSEKPIDYETRLMYKEELHSEHR